MIFTHLFFFNKRYWSTSNNSCISCPTDYLTGYGFGVFNSSNRITNRCYRTINTISANYEKAQSICQEDSANLVTIRNIMELRMIQTQFLVQNQEFIVN